MGKVNCIPHDGELEYFFNSQDHLPYHIHVKHKGGEWEIRVYFLLCTPNKLEYDYKFPPSARTLPRRFKDKILKNVIKNKEALLKEWERKVQTS